MGDDFAEFNIALLVLGVPLFVLGAAILVLLTRRRPSETRVPIARTVWFVSMLALAWLDAGTLIFAFSVEEGSWWIYHVLSAGALTVILLGFAPWDGKYRTELSMGMLAIWAWALLLPWIPWSQSKRMALDVWRIQGQPLEVVQGVMGGYRVDVQRSTGGDVNGWVRDLDLVSLQPEGMTFYPGLGGSSVGVRDGVVSGASFCYD